MLKAAIVDCNHCGRTVRNQGRGLCATCYKDNTVRILYPAHERYYAQHPDALTTRGFINVIRPLPPYPTTAMPGTPEKIAVMTQRLLDGYHIHHPNDPKLRANLMEILSYVG